MSSIRTSLPPLDFSLSELSETLPELPPLFFVPPLADRLHEPISDGLVKESVPPDPCGLSHVPVFISEADLEDAEETVEDLWAGKNMNRPRRNKNLSWDALWSASFSTKLYSTPFLSQQSNDAFNAVRCFVRPRFNDSSLELQFMLPDELLDLLLINLTGNSSPLYIWGMEDERFVPKMTRGDKRQVVIVEGFDDVVSESIIKRFLTIGALMRRLDMLVASVQQQCNNSVVHAFSYAVSTVLEHIHSALTRKHPLPASRLASLWLHYADAESLLSALAVLCCREENETPPYDQLPDLPATLLSHIYKQLQRHIDNRSPRSITAMVAYILTTTSRHYFSEIEESLGIQGLSHQAWLRKNPRSKSDYRNSWMFQLESDVLDQSLMSSTIHHSDKNESPEFFPPELTDALPAARKSLRILQVADPDHPLCSTTAVTQCEWVWSSAEVERLWTDLEIHFQPQDIVENPHTVLPEFVAPSTKDKPELDQVYLFDLEPGAHMNSQTLSKSSTSHTSFTSFLSVFPERLPPLTPTLHHLTTVVLQPLLNRTTHLSSSLLCLYLTDLHLEMHFVLLRSYLLLTSPSFKTRLVEALFSDSDDYPPVDRARTRALLGIQDKSDSFGSTNNYGTGQGIGLGHGLAGRDVSPLDGADLNFFLRTVIVDSLEQRTTARGHDKAGVVWKEAEVRMGFALHDPSVGDSREMWLNPMSIEALDFLYLDYKPPRPLDIVITADILSKYQRIFTFLLQLLRAQTVARIAFRILFKSGSPVFQYIPQAQQLFIRLRFQIQTFITSFVTYIFDSAIGGNFDAYLRRVSYLRQVIEGNTLTANTPEIIDVFMLEASHSELLNQILNGCLLRTNQRSAGETLKGLLELILQFGTMIMDIRLGRLTEAYAADRLGDLNRSYQNQMFSFVKAVQMLHMKDKNSGDHVSLLHLKVLRGHDLDTEMSSPFGEILTRVDPTRWWRQKLEKMAC